MKGSQSAKGAAAPFSFSLSPQKKVAKGNVLTAGLKKQALMPVEAHDTNQQAAHGTQEPPSDAPAKSKPKRTRWGPDQLIKSPTPPKRPPALTTASDRTPDTSISPPAQPNRSDTQPPFLSPPNSAKGHAATNGNEGPSPPVRSTVQHLSSPTDRRSHRHSSRHPSRDSSRHTSRHTSRHPSRDSSRGPSIGPSSHAESDRRASTHSAYPSVSPEQQPHSSRKRMPARDHDRYNDHAAGRHDREVDAQVNLHDRHDRMSHDVHEREPDDRHNRHVRHSYDKQTHDRQSYNRQSHDRQAHDRQAHDRQAHDRQSHDMQQAHQRDSQLASRHRQDTPKYLHERSHRSAEKRPLHDQQHAYHSDRRHEQSSRTDYRPGDAREGMEGHAHGHRREDRPRSAHRQSHRSFSRSVEPQELQRPHVGGRHGRRSRESTPTPARSPSHHEEGQIEDKAPAQPSVPEPISFKITQRSTRQLNINPDSPDPNSRPPLPTLPSMTSPQAPAPAQPDAQQPIDAPVIQPASVTTQPMEAVMLSSLSQEQLQLPPHNHLTDASPRSSESPATLAAADMPATHIKDIQPAMALQAGADAPASSAIAVRDPSQLPATHAQLDKVNLQHDNAAEPASAQPHDMADHPDPGSPANDRSVPTNSNGMPMHDQRQPGESSRLQSRSLPHPAAVRNSRRNSIDRPYRSEVPDQADSPQAHVRGYPSHPPSPRDRAQHHGRSALHDRPVVKDRADAKDRLMTEDRHQPDNRQLASNQVERTRPQRRFSDHPSGSRSPGSKRSRDAEHVPAHDLAKRSRTDHWQHAAPPQAAHHRSLDIRNAKREADRLAAVRRQEERDSSQSQSPGSDRHRHVPNGNHAPRYMPSRHNMHSVQHEQSMSMSPPAPRGRGSPTPDPKTAPRFNHLDSAAFVRREAFQDPSRGPQAQLRDPDSRRDGSWSSAGPHTNEDAAASRKYSNYGRHPKLSAVNGDDYLERPSPAEQDFLERQQSFLHSSQPGDRYIECQPSRAHALRPRSEHESDRSVRDKMHRHRSSGTDRPHEQHAMPRQLSDSLSPSRHQAESRHDKHRHTSEQATLQMQQQSEAAKQAAAVKLDEDMNSLMAKLFEAYGLPASAMGNGPLLKNEQRSGLFDLMSAAVSETEAMDAKVFTMTRLRLPSWLPPARQQQLQRMLVPAAWLLQDDKYQPEWQLPVGWHPPACTDDAYLPLAEPLNPHMHIDCDCAKKADDLLVDADSSHVVVVPWTVAEPEAGELETPTLPDPRPPAAVTAPASLPLVLPFPMFPFLPSKRDLPTEQSGTNEFAEKGLQVETPMDQLVPGGYLHFLWDMDNRAPSPTGSWSTSPPHEAEDVGNTWGPAGYADHPTVPTPTEPPPAPGHVLSTDQRYTEELHTTDPAGYAHAHWPTAEGYQPPLQQPYTADWQNAPYQQPPQIHDQATYPPYQHAHQVPPHHQIQETALQFSQLQQALAQQHQQQQHQQQQSGLVPPPPPSRPPPPECPPAPILQHPTQFPEPEADRYKYQVWVDDRQEMSEVHSLMWYRDHLRQGHPDLIAGMSVYDEDHDLWLPLHQHRWTPDELRWEGIDHMLLQGQPATAEACTSAAALSDSALDNWLEHISVHAMHRSQPGHRQLPVTARAATAAAAPGSSCSTANGAHTAARAAVVSSATAPADPATTSAHAVPMTDSQQHAEQLRSGIAPLSHISRQRQAVEAVIMQLDADDSLLESAAASEAWFENFDTSQQQKSGGQPSAAARSGRCRGRCWGPPVPAQFPAMLRGTFAQAVLGGIAGKSLINQVLDKAVQQVLDRRKL